MLQDQYDDLLEWRMQRLGEELTAVTANERMKGWLYWRRATMTTSGHEHGDNIERQPRWPRSAAPAELKWWHRLSLLLVIMFFGLGAVTTNRPVFGVVLVLGAFVQIRFGLALATNCQSFADQLAEYYAHRPLMLGGFRPNHSVWMNRIQGSMMTITGLVLIVLGVALLIGVK